MVAAAVGAERNASQRVADLQKQLRAVQTDHDLLQQQAREDAEEHARQAAAAAALASKRIQALEADLAAATAQHDAHLEECGEAKKQTAARLAETQRQLATLEAESAAEVQRLTGELDDAAKQGVAAATASKKRVDGLAAELAAARDEHTAHMTECAQAQRVTQAKITELQTKLEKTEWELKTQLHAVTDERDELLSKGSASEQATARRQRALEDALHVAKQEVDDLTAALAKARADADTERKRAQALEREKAELTAEMEETHDVATNRIHEMTAQVSKLQRDLAHAREAAEAAAADFEERLRPLPELQAEHASLARRLAAATEEARAAEDRVDELQALLRSQEEAHKRATAAAQAAQAALDEARARHAEEKDKVLAEWDAARVRAEQASLRATATAAEKVGGPRYKTLHSQSPLMCMSRLTSKMLLSLGGLQADAEAEAARRKDAFDALTKERDRLVKESEAAVEALQAQVHIHAVESVPRPVQSSESSLSVRFHLLYRRSGEGRGGPRQEDAGGAVGAARGARQAGGGPGQVRGAGGLGADGLRRPAGALHRTRLKQYAFVTCLTIRLVHTSHRRLSRNAPTPTRRTPPRCWRPWRKSSRPSRTAPRGRRRRAARRWPPRRGRWPRRRPPWPPWRGA
jgi:chromosome segregation ATPase